MSDTHERNSDEGAPSDGSAGPALPAGGLKTRTAWSGAGDDMEMEHQREQYRRARGGGGAGLGGSATAVDLGQFRNTEVGIGYQAAGVLRQRTAASAGQRTIELRDTTAAASGTGKRKRLQDGTREHYASDQGVFSPEKSSSRHRRGGNKSVTKPKKDIEMYIRSKGLREFRLELEKILSS